jgi:hypothetical protein
MPQYEQKTDRRKFEVDTPDLSLDATDLVVRLWSPEWSDRRAPCHGMPTVFSFT